MSPTSVQMAMHHQLRFHARVLWPNSATKFLQVCVLELHTALCQKPQQAVGDHQEVASWASSRVATFNRAPAAPVPEA